VVSSLFAATNPQLGLGECRATLLAVQALASVTVFDNHALSIDEQLLKLLCVGESQELGEVIDLDVSCDEAHDELLEALDADLVDEDVDKGRAFAWSRTVELEEAAVVALGEGVAGLEGVRH